VTVTSPGSQRGPLHPLAIGLALGGSAVVWLALQWLKGAL
jgi:hypothetical protein